MDFDVIDAEPAAAHRVPAQRAVLCPCEADEPLLPQALAYIGEDQVVYASDFPHWDHRFPKSIAELKGRPDLTDAQKRKVLADNARRLYRLT